MLWAQAREDLKLSEDEFWRLTPLLLHTLITQHKRNQERDEFLFGQLNKNIVNFAMCHPKEPARIEDFMPSQWHKSARQRTEQTLEDLRVKFRHAVLMGQKHTTPYAPKA